MHKYNFRYGFVKEPRSVFFSGQAKSARIFPLLALFAWKKTLIVIYQSGLIICKELDTCVNTSNLGKLF